MTVKNTFVPPRVGDKVTFRKTMTVAEQAMFTGISGHMGGLYVDRTQAAAAGLSDMAVFELAAASLFTTALARMAGPTHRVAEFATRFERAVPVGTTIAASAVLTAMEGASLRFTLNADVDGRPYCSGEALLVPVAKG
jgi:3-hydroxybutyryl-CoA dehydratase